MALVIGVSSGSRIYLNDVPVDVVKADSYDEIKLKVEDKEFTITPKEMTEIYPTVWVSSGIPKQPKMEMLPRLIFEADRSVVILRSELYERQYGVR